METFLAVGDNKTLVVMAESLPKAQNALIKFLVGPGFVVTALGPNKVKVTDSNLVVIYILVPAVVIKG